MRVINIDTHRVLNFPDTKAAESYATNYCVNHPVDNPTWQYDRDGEIVIAHNPED